MSTRPKLTLYQNYLATIIVILAICFPSIQRVNATVHSVQLYKLYSSQLGQLVTSSTLVWETYLNDPKQLEFAVQGGKVITDDEHYPIYVCRATVEGIYVSGHTEKRRQKYVCVVSLLMVVKSHSNFDVLVNKGHLGKLTWKTWSKFVAGIPNGAVSVSGNYHGDGVLYVARYKVKHGHQQNHPEEVDNGQYGADYHLGRFDPNAGFGKVFVTEGDRDKEYKEGEILVETEPFRYELRDINIDKWKTEISINQTNLNSAILANKGDITNLVETVISYEYDRVQYWGTYDGTARGLPTRIYEHSSSLPEEIHWGLKYSEKRIETKAVSTNLIPGTAMNVTLKGNYTSMQAPYTATLVAFYSDHEETVSRKISSTVQKADLHDIRLDFSPIYWIDNGTLLPTTTTTTTTTTTEPTTTTTKEPKPIYSPPIVNVTDIGGGSSSSGSSGSISKEIDLSGKKHIDDDMDISRNDIAADQSRESHPAGESVKMRNTAEKKDGNSSAQSLIWTSTSRPLLIFMGIVIIASIRPLVPLTTLYY